MLQYCQNWRQYPWEVKKDHLNGLDQWAKGWGLSVGYVACWEWQNDDRVEQNIGLELWRYVILNILVSPEVWNMETVCYLAWGTRHLTRLTLVRDGDFPLWLGLDSMFRIFPVGLLGLNCWAMRYVCRLRRSEFGDTSGRGNDSDVWRLICSWAYLWISLPILGCRK